MIQPLATVVLGDRLEDGDVEGEVFADEVDTGLIKERDVMEVGGYISRGSGECCASSCHMLGGTEAIITVTDTSGGGACNDTTVSLGDMVEECGVDSGWA